jgi:predicted amino acid dehydrogenase
MFDDEIDLSDAELFADGNRGIYIPQHFAESVLREHVQGVSAEDYAILEAGPDHEWYWETWESVCDNAVITTPQGKRYYFYQDGDLWCVPFRD